MKLTPDALEASVADRLAGLGFAEAKDMAWACAWLQSCGYSGLKMLAEALEDELKTVDLIRDAVGFDLANVSCVFLAPRIVADVERHGRVFLRNVRHGLYLLPFAVRGNMGIGCPVDPAFALGGERTKNPYNERLAAAANGIEIDDALWQRVLS